MKTKNILSILTVMALSVTVLHAQDAIEKYFEKYSANPEFTSIVVSSKMFELFANVQVDAPENADFKEAIKGLKGIKILAYDQSEKPDAQLTDFKSAVKKVGSEYEILMSIDDKDEKVRFYILESGNMIKELFMVVGGKNNLFLMSLVGDIDLEKMSTLSKKMNIGGMNYLENLDEKGKTK